MTWLHRAVVYPATVHLRGEGEVFGAIGELEVLQAASPAEHDAAVQRRLASIIGFAGRKVPLYRRRWGAVGAPDPSVAELLLAEIPLLSKEDVQRHADELRAADGPWRVTHKTTGGSTGQVVTIVKDRSATAHEMAASWLGYGWYGIAPGDRSARFWGAPTTARRWLRATLTDFVMNRVRFSAFAFRDADLERYWSRCLAFEPAYFYGYVSMLEQFARFVLARGYDPSELGLRAVVTTSEVLTGPQRELIERAFGAPVQNEYGCGEVGPIAYECPNGSLHVMSPNVHVEVLTERGLPAEDGEIGEVVITDLHNRAMPLVRYRLGDLAIRGRPCACGRSFPVLATVVGRSLDFVETPDGRRYHGEFFAYLCEDLRAAGCPVERIQVTQHVPDSVELSVVLAEATLGVDRVADQILAEARTRLPGMHVTLRHVREIPRTAGGKLRVVENRIQPRVRDHVPAVPVA